jgi:hypothetical protein
MSCEIYAEIGRGIAVPKGLLLNAITSWFEAQLAAGLVQGRITPAARHAAPRYNEKTGARISDAVTVTPERKDYLVGDKSLPTVEAAIVALTGVEPDNRIECMAGAAIHLLSWLLVAEVVPDTAEYWDNLKDKECIVLQPTGVSVKQVNGVCAAMQGYASGLDTPVLIPIAVPDSLVALRAATLEFLSKHGINYAPEYYFFYSQHWS